jgi:hypothetical protein
VEHSPELEREVFDIPTLPNEIWILILANLEVKESFRLASVSKVFQRQTYDSVTSIRLGNPFDFGTINIYDYLENNILEKFRNLLLLELPHKHLITDDGMKSIGTLTTLNLTSNFRISSNGIKHLTNLTKLNLCNKFSNGSEDLDRTNIYNEGIQYLTKITTLHLETNKFITNDGLRYLTNITELFLRQNEVITDEGIKHLIKINTLNLQYNGLITNNVMKFLTG